MNNLSYDQKLILLLYKLFYQTQYPTVLLKDEERTKTHINAQKLCFLLKLNGLDIGDFGYAWNFRGPYSPGLLVVLRSLDANIESVKDYYTSDEKLDKLLTDEEHKRVRTLIRDLLISKHRNDKSSWMELLGSIAFLSNSVLPGEDFDRIEEELHSRKDQFNDSENNRAAWDALSKAGILKTAN